MAFYMAKHVVFNTKSYQNLGCETLVPIPKTLYF